VKVQSADDLRERVLCLADTEVRSAETEVCDCSKNNWLSINQLELQGA
jgi:hypothetical protein